MRRAAEGEEWGGGGHVLEAPRRCTVFSYTSTLVPERRTATCEGRRGIWGGGGNQTYRGEDKDGTAEHQQRGGATRPGCVRGLVQVAAMERHEYLSGGTPQVGGRPVSAVVSRGCDATSKCFQQSQKCVCGKELTGFRTASGRPLRNHQVAAHCGKKKYI